MDPQEGDHLYIPIQLDYNLGTPHNGVLLMEGIFFNSGLTMLMLLQDPLLLPMKLLQSDYLYIAIYCALLLCSKLCKGLLKCF